MTVKSAVHSEKRIGEFAIGFWNCLVVCEPDFPFSLTSVLKVQGEAEPERPSDWYGPVTCVQSCQLQRCPRTYSIV